MMQGGREQSPMALGGAASEDDMAEGDLGDGMGQRPGAASIRKNLWSRSRGHAAELSKRGSEGGEAAFTWTSCRGLYTVFRQELEGEQPPPRWRVQGSESLFDLTIEELRVRLQEVTEEAELLRCELEVTHRHLEGKQEAVKILQGQAILDKATTHTKSLLQKSEERTKALEKEVNALQWEITFNQMQFQSFQQSWEQKYDRVCCENKALSDSLEDRVRQVQELRSENAALSQQCLELLAMLSVREQKTFQGTKPPCSQGSEGTVLELAVLGACQCPSVREPCPCARSAAASRKQVLQLRQELDVQRRRRDEALMVADAFRIAFEQQLKRRSDHFLLMAETDRQKSHPHKPEGGSDKRTFLSVAQRLRGLLPSSAVGKISDDPTETLHKLLDLLNDREEALAHQRKVSLMLGHSVKEMERRLQTDSRQDTGQDCAASGTDSSNHVQQGVGEHPCQGVASLLDCPEFQHSKIREVKTEATEPQIQCLSLGQPLTERGIVDKGCGKEEGCGTCS